MAKTAKIRMTTAPVELNYINVVNPDGKFSPNNPKYQVSWKLGPAEGKAFIAEVVEKMPSMKGKVPHRRDDDDNYIFKATQKKFIEWVAAGEKKSVQFTPVLLNQDNTPYEGREPWGGSVGEVAFILRETKGEAGAGLTFSLQGVRFHEVKIGNGEGGDGFDPLFGNNTKASAAAEPEVFEQDDEDDVPFN
jgi:hypothetical protein